MAKTILITGATAGIGQAAARRFAAGGAKVAMLPKKNRGEIVSVVVTLGRLSDGWGEIDLLLNNAGLAPPMNDLQDSDWDKVETVLDTNISGLVALTRAVLPKLIERQGAVINLSSVAATYPYKGGAVYGASKRRTNSMPA